MKNIKRVLCTIVAFTIVLSCVAVLPSFAEGAGQRKQGLSHFVKGVDSGMIFYDNSSDYPYSYMEGEASWYYDTSNKNYWYSLTPRHYSSMYDDCRDGKGADGVIEGGIFVYSVDFFASSDGDIVSAGEEEDPRYTAYTQVWQGDKSEDAGGGVLFTWNLYPKAPDKKPTLGFVKDSVNNAAWNPQNSFIYEYDYDTVHNAKIVIDMNKGTMKYYVDGGWIGECTNKTDIEKYYQLGAIYRQVPVMKNVNVEKSKDAMVCMDNFTIYHYPSETPLVNLDFEDSKWPDTNKFYYVRGKDTASGDTHEFNDDPYNTYYYCKQIDYQDKDGNNSKKLRLEFSDFWLYAKYKAVKFPFANGLKVSSGIVTIEFDAGYYDGGNNSDISKQWVIFGLNDTTRQEESFKCDGSREVVKDTNEETQETKENKLKAVTSNSTAFLGLTTWDKGIHSVALGSDYNRTKPYDYYCYDGYDGDDKTKPKGSIGFANDNDNTMHHYKIVADLDANTYSVSMDGGAATVEDSLPGGVKDGVYDSFVLTAVDRTRSTTTTPKNFYADIDNLKVSVAITDTPPEPKSLECTRDGNNKVTKAQIFDKKGLFDFAKIANNNELADGVYVSLENDITFNDKEQWTPIANFKGTFDGKEHTIRNLYMLTIEDKHAREENLPVAPPENKFAYNGFFSCVNDGSTIQNINFDGARLLAHWDDLARGGRYEYNGEKAVVAGQTKGTTTFKNITLTNCYAETYNNSVSGLISETYGNTTLSNINIDNTNYFSSLWGSYDTCVGGIIARADGNYKYNMTNCNVAAVINAVNDVCANYQWYMYRRCGMLIGCLADKGNDSYMDCLGTLENNTVTFDAWNQYVYCEYEKNGHPAYSAPDEYKWSRINSPKLPSEGMGTKFSEEYGEPGTDKHKATHEGHQYEDPEHCCQLMAFRSIIGFCPNNSAYIGIHDYPVTADTKIPGIEVVDQPMMALSKSLKMSKPPVQQAVMTDASGNQVDTATKEAILNEITTNDAVNNFEETGVEQVAEQLGADAMKALLMGATEDEAVLGNIGDDTEVKSQMSVKFSNAAIDENGAVNELEFDIKPVVWAVVLGDHKQDVLVEAVIPNESIESELTVLLPIPDSVEVGTPVKILHNGEEYADAIVKLVDGCKVVELKASSFSSFKLLFGNSAEPQETPEPKWSYAWDSGKYDDNGVEKGVVRYLFGTDLADEDVQESKIVFFGENPVKDDNDKFTAKSTSGVGAFFSDLYGLDPSEPRTVYGVGCVKVGGQYIWSDIQDNMFDFTKIIENYQPIQ